MPLLGRYRAAICGLILADGKKLENNLGEGLLCLALVAWLARLLLKYF